MRCKKAKGGIKRLDKLRSSDEAARRAPRRGSPPKPIKSFPRDHTVGESLQERENRNLGAARTSCVFRKSLSSKGDDRRVSTAALYASRFFFLFLAPSLFPGGPRGHVQKGEKASEAQPCSRENPARARGKTAKARGACGIRIP